MSTLPVLVAPDSFKGTMSAGTVAAAVARGLRAGGREAVELPIGDGGEGTMDALGGDVLVASASDPLGRPVEARFSLAGHQGIVEAAEASGIRLVKESERDAFAASTRGTGELIAAAVDAGARSVLLAVGGSATTDGGAGALQALDSAGVPSDFPITVLCDVRTAWEDSPRVFGPQKGADARTVKRLERRLDKLASSAPRDPRGVPMTGCAGGLSGGLWAFRGAKLVPGAAFVLDAIGFDDAMRAARYVVTGEGKLDAQTLEGKACAEVATRARQGGVACHAVVGKNDLDDFRARVLDFGLVIEAGDEPALEEAGRRLASL